MGAVFFYHLTQQSVDQALSALLPKCLDNKWKVLVRAPDLDQLQRLDQSLWTHREDSFLPHGLAGGPHDEAQPILLAPEGTNTPHDCLVVLHGAGLTADEVHVAQRTLILFEEADGMQISNARQQWSELTTAGCSAQYWSQETGRWVKKAEKN